MPSDSLVSVIINNYNYGRFLAEALQSVLDQSYKPIEIIVVDDGSTDNSREVLRSYDARYPGRFQTILQENGGQASAMNAGLAVAHGQVVCFLDSDDYWFGRKIESVAAHHTKFGVVQHNLLQNGQRYRLLLNTGDLQFFLKEYGLIRSCVPTSAMSFRRDVLEKFFPLPEEPLRLCADAYLRCAALYFSPVRSLDECLGVYRLHGKNGWHDNVRHTRPNIATEIVILLNRMLVDRNLPPIPIRKDSNEKAFLHSLPIEKGKKYVLYGTGDMGQKLDHYIESLGGHVLAYCDDDETKCGKQILGKPVIAPAELPSWRRQVDAIVVAAYIVERIYEKLVAMGLQYPQDILLPIDLEGHITEIRPQAVAQKPAPKPNIIGQINKVRHTPEEVLQHLASLQFSPRYVVDVGVAHGTPWLYKAFPKSHFLLVEPLVEFEDRMKEISLHYNAEYAIAAAGKENGDTELFVPPDLTGSTLLVKPNDQFARRTVPVCRLDTLCKEHRIQEGPIFLKVDVQGAEMAVIQGATGILQWVEVIILEICLFEFRPGMPLITDVFNIMRGHGYLPYDFIDGHNRPLDWALAQVDVVFVKENGFFRRTNQWSTPEQTLAFHQAKKDQLMR